MRKILYSPGFGAGWTTWHSGSAEEIQFMLEYQPFIERLESGGKIDQKLEEQFINDFEEKFQTPAPYTGGLRNLQVATVSRRVRIHEYDGSESYEEEGEFSGWV